MTDKQVLRALFPGRHLMLDDGRVEADVYPLGVPQIRQFTDQLVVPFSSLYKSAAAGSSESQVGAQLVGFLVPHVVRSMTDILDQCVIVSVDTEGHVPGGAERVEVKVSELPHHFLPPIAEAWVEESFGDEKKRAPWIAAMASIWKTMTGEELSTSEMLSRFASPLATPEPTSST